MEIEINPRTGSQYYAGSSANVKLICTMLKIDGGRLSQITESKVHDYMDMVENTIDGILEEYYFTPIRPYNIVMPDGRMVLQFPGRLRGIAQYWAAGLLIQAQMSAAEPNANESAAAYILSSKQEIFQMTLFNQRIPGQIIKSGWGRTMPPSMQPGMMPEKDF